MTFRLNTQVESVQDGKTCAYVTVRDSGNGAGSTGNRNTNDPTGSGTDGSRQVLEAEAVLLATGRKPNTAGLNLEAARHPYRPARFRHGGRPPQTTTRKYGRWAM